MKEKVIFSCFVNINTSWLKILGKKRTLVITTEQIIQCNGKNNEIRSKHPYTDLMGITKSLIQGN